MRSNAVSSAAAKQQHCTERRLEQKLADRVLPICSHRRKDQPAVRRATQRNSSTQLQARRYLSRSWRLTRSLHDLLLSSATLFDRLVPEFARWEHGLGRTRESKPDAIRKPHRFELIRDRGVHDWTIPKTLKMGCGALMRITPVHFQ